MSVENDKNSNGEIEQKNEELNSNNELKENVESEVEEAFKQALKDGDHNSEVLEEQANNMLDKSESYSSLEKPFYKSTKFILLLILLLGIAGVAYFVFNSFKKQNIQLMQLKNEFDSKIVVLDEKHNYQSEITKLENKIVQLKTNFLNNSSIDNSELQTQINNQKLELELLRQQLINDATQLNKSEHFKTIEWQLAEAKYLLRIAQQRIVMEKDVVGALSVLVAVDAVLLNTQDISLYNVREILALDKSKLEVVQKLDVEGVYIQLGNIRSQIEQFEFFAVVISAIENKKSFKEIFFDSFNVRDLSGDYVGQLDPVLHNIAKQSLVLMLEQTQSALLNNQQGIFKMSLAKSKLQLSQYFSTEIQFDSITSQLSGFEAMTLSQALPDVLNTIQALDSYLINLSK